MNTDFPSWWRNQVGGVTKNLFHSTTWKIKNIVFVKDIVKDALPFLDLKYHKHIEIRLE